MNFDQKAKNAFSKTVKLSLSLMESILLETKICVVWHNPIQNAQTKKCLMPIGGPQTMAIPQTAKPSA